MSYEEICRAVQSSIEHMRFVFNKEPTIVYMSEENLKILKKGFEMAIHDGSNIMSPDIKLKFFGLDIRIHDSSKIIIE